jgi:hypothetical protein
VSLPLSSPIQLPQALLPPDLSTPSPSVPGPTGPKSTCFKPFDSQVHQSPRPPAPSSICSQAHLTQGPPAPGLVALQVQLPSKYACPPLFCQDLCCTRFHFWSRAGVSESCGYSWVICRRMTPQPSGAAFPAGA